MNGAQKLTAFIVSGVEAFEYDTNGRLWRHRLDGVTVATVTYNTVGELRIVTYGNGTVLADLDVAGRRFADRSVRELAFTGPAGTVTSNTITARDRDGRVTAETVDGQEYRYGYDAFERLVRAEFGPTGFTTASDDWQYCYQDPAGVNGAAPACTPGDVNPAGVNANRTAAYHNGVKTAGYSYDLADRLTAVTVQAPYAGNTVGYDTRGNTTSLAGETLGYDAADRHLTTTKAGNTVTYHRDVLDRIVARTGTDGTTRYTYGAGADTTSAVLDTSNLLVHTTIALPGGVLLSKAAGGETWSYPNLHGSITAITDTAGVKQGGTFHYDPYGNPISGLPNNLAGDLDYGWLGQHQRPAEHPTGLRTQIDMGARGYDPQLARFLETDPIEGGVNNDYNYPTNPRHDLDLDGRAACTSAQLVDAKRRGVQAGWTTSAVGGVRRTVLASGWRCSAFVSPWFPYPAPRLPFSNTWSHPFGNVTILEQQIRYLDLAFAGPGGMQIVLSGSQVRRRNRQCFDPYVGPSVCKTYWLSYPVIWGTPTANLGAQSGSW